MTASGSPGTVMTMPIDSSMIPSLPVEKTGGLVLPPELPLPEPDGRKYSS